MTTLSNQMLSWVTERTNAAVGRFLPDLRWPRYFAGVMPAPQDVANLAYLAAELHRAGVREIAGRSVPQLAAVALSQLDGRKTETWWSLFAAESLLAFGKFDEANPVVSAWNEAQRRNAIEAVDTTSMYDPATDSLRGFLNNYWAVLARAEHARLELGLSHDRRLLERALAEVRRIVSRSPLGFFDDSTDLAGQFDAYTVDVLLVLEPLWPMLDPAVVRQMQLSHVRLIESIALENGASIAWGRSIGVLSLCITMEVLALSLRHGLAAEPKRSVGLIRHAFESIKDWFADDLIAIHRHRMTYGYRGIPRLLQMTFDVLSKVAQVANLIKPLGGVPVEGDLSRLFPPKDEWIPFESNRFTGVWMVRHGPWACQLPLVSGANADYVSWFRQPGLLENPVDTTMFCGVPRVMFGGVDHIWYGPPVAMEKTPLGLSATFDTLRNAQGLHAATTSTVPAQRRVTYQFDSRALHVTEDWQFDRAPEAVVLEIPEVGRGLELAVECPTPFIRTEIAVAGMTAWRSFWGEIRKVHHIRFEPGSRMQWRYTITPDPAAAGRS